MTQHAAVDSSSTDPVNVVLVGAACGSGLIMLTAVLTAVFLAVRTQHHRRYHRQRSVAPGCCCCCCWDAKDHGPSRYRSLAFCITVDMKPITRTK